MWVSTLLSSFRVFPRCRRLKKAYLGQKVCISISQEVVDEIGDELMNFSFFLYSCKCIGGHVFLNLRHSNIVTGENRQKTKANGEPNSPFYSCVLSDLPLDWKRGWGYLVLIQTSLLFICK